MGLSGAGFGASKALEEILGEQMLRARMAQQQQQQAAQMEMERARLAESARQADVDSGQRQQQIDLQAGDRRERSNIKGVRRMLGEAITQRTGPMTSDDRRGLAALQIEAGDDPTLLNEPKPERDPIADYEAKAAIDARFRPPQRPERDPIADHEAKLRLEQKYKTGQATGPTPYAQERSARTLQSVDELMGKISGKTAGWGNLAAGIPASDAMNFASELDTLKANIAFNELTQMREASKTGGALGQVSNIELKLLESALGALNPRQSPENLKAQLSKIKESISRWQQAQGVGDASPQAGLGPEPRMGRTGAPAPADDPVAALIAKYGRKPE